MAKVCTEIYAYDDTTAGPLTGAVSSCFKFGIGKSTGDMYYRDLNNNWQPSPSGGGGTGTVTSFAFTNSTGITGTVTNSTTTPTLSLALAWSAIGSGKPTTLAGYGITDAYPLAGNPSGFITASSSSALTNKTGNISQWTNDSSYLTTTSATSTYLPLAGGTITGNIIPNAAASLNLGSASLGFNNLYTYIIKGANNLDIQANSNLIRFNSAGGTTLANFNNGKWMFGSSSTATAIVQLAAGTATAGTAPSKYTAGVVLTTPESGVTETDATNNKFYTNSSGVRARQGMWAYKAVTTTYTATDGDYTIDCTGGGTFTVTLPSSIAGRPYTITNSGTGTITIATTSSQTFTNVATTPTTLSIVSYGTYQVQGTGSAFLVISKV